MKRAYLLLICLTLTTTLAWLPACQSPDVTGPIENDLLTREQDPNLDDPYGGYNVADEAPGFDDPALLEEFGEKAVEEFDDPISLEPLVADIVAMPLPQHFLMITWGNIERDTTIDFVTEWSGSLTIDLGAIILKRVIRFENHDRILPRERRDLLEWVSYTQPAFDGIIVRLLPISRPSTADVADTTSLVTFATGPLTISFSLEELRDIHRVIPVDNAGNAVAFNSIVIPARPCPHGFLGGIWKANPDAAGGKFFGMWMNEKGGHMGFLKGFYGVNSAGENVFYGKWIGLSGKFRGLLKGRWGVFPDALGGFFEGVYLNRQLHVIGDLKGVWKTSEHINGGGFFRGRWARRCYSLTR